MSAESQFEADRENQAVGPDECPTCGYVKCECEEPEESPLLKVYRIIEAAWLQLAEQEDQIIFDAMGRREKFVREAAEFRAKIRQLEGA